MTDHIKAKKRVQSISSIATFDALLEASTLCEDDKQILRMIYLQHKDLRYIGDILGFSETTIKRRHAKALSKLNKLF